MAVPGAVVGLDSIPNDLPRGRHRGAGRVHVVAFGPAAVWSAEVDDGGGEPRFFGSPGH